MATDDGRRRYIRKELFVSVRRLQETCHNSEEGVVGLCLGEGGFSLY
jgi:hypothetical protein